MQAEETEECKGCGQPIAESTDPANEFRYETSVYRCHACTAKDAGGERYEREKPGLYLSVKKT